MNLLISQIGRRGALVIPAVLRKRYGFKDGVNVIAEAREEGVMIRAVSVSPVEVYTRKRKAEFLLNNAVSAADYRLAVRDVKALGLDPSSIQHEPPATS